MKTANVRQIRNAFPSLLRRVEKGETVTITKRGKAVAAITPLPRKKGGKPWADHEEWLLAQFPEPLEGVTAAGMVSYGRGDIPRHG